MEIPIECLTCHRRWKLSFEISKRLTSIAAICDCGEVFAGTYFPHTRHEFKFSTNGRFKLLESTSEDYMRLIAEH